jgi:hypothetical membrane protein
VTDRTHASGRLVSIAGTLLVLAGCLALMGIISAETFYPAYSTAQNDISDLGATRPPNSVVHQPSAVIFNTTMLGTGLLVIGAAVALFRAGQARKVVVPLGLFGLGAFLVGVFPGNWGTVHGLSALLTFVAGAVAAMTAATAIRSPVRFVTAALGGISLLTLVSYYVLRAASPMLVFGPGGLERWVAYPIVLFVLAYGGYLAGDARRAAEL